LSLGELSSCAFSISSLFVWIGSAGTLRLSFLAFLTGVRLDFLRPRFGVEVPLQKKKKIFHLYIRKSRMSIHTISRSSPYFITRDDPLCGSEKMN